MRYSDLLNGHVIKTYDAAGLLRMTYTVINRRIKVITNTTNGTHGVVCNAVNSLGEEFQTAITGQRMDAILSSAGVKVEMPLPPAATAVEPSTVTFEELFGERT